jgi:hypothetical protein
MAYCISANCMPECRNHNQPTGASRMAEASGQREPLADQVRIMEAEHRGQWGDRETLVNSFTQKTLHSMSHLDYGGSYWCVPSVLLSALVQYAAKLDQGLRDELAALLRLVAERIEG